MSSCLDKVDIESKNFIQKQLVVEGNINNGDGPYVVKLSYAFSINEENKRQIKNQGIFDAEVAIINSTSGDRLELIPSKIPSEWGIYKSPINSSFKGLNQNEYYLEIEVENEIYQSSREKIVTASSMDSIYAVYNENTRKMEVFVDFTDPESSKDYYIWEWNGYKRIRTFLPDVPFIECCNICYIPLQGNDINVFEDEFQNGQSIKKQKISDFFIIRFNVFLIEVQQHRLNKEAYDFWNLLKLQQESQGSLFDPPPFGIKGNISNINNKDETVLGYFYASGISEDHLKFSAFEYAVFQSPFEGTEDDCRKLAKADTLKPVNWD